MKAELLHLTYLIALVFAGPARRDCGETKSFIATNECGLQYGGTWVECATGITAIPTFSVPECTPTPTATYPLNNATTTNTSLIITSAPSASLPSATYLAYNTTCSPLLICVDAIKVCGPMTIPYGACYDTCTQRSLVEPTCTLPPVPVTPKPEPVRNYTSVYKPAPRPHLDICDSQPWRCAPAGW